LSYNPILQKQGIKEGFMTDNDRKNKKKIAVMAAVANYIKTEQEALMASQMASLPPKEPEKTPLVLNLWGIGGRQQQMQMRQMMQMKAFHGARLKI
jgi:hypothetical protein